MNKITYIIYRPNEGITLGFASAIDAEGFITAQSANIEWQASWKIERVFAYGEFHWTASTDKSIALHFNQQP